MKLTIRVDNLTYSRLESYSRINETSVSDVVRKAISTFFDSSKKEEDVNAKMQELAKLTDILFDINDNIKTGFDENSTNFIHILNTFLNVFREKSELILSIWKQGENNNE